MLFSVLTHSRCLENQMDKAGSIVAQMIEWNTNGVYINQLLQIAINLIITLMRMLMMEVVSNDPDNKRFHVDTTLKIQIYLISHVRINLLSRYSHVKITL